MIFNDSVSSAEIPPANPLRVPRLNSLEHRLQHAKDTAGQPLPLIDELLFLLDDPPAGTADRWQAGADFCASHGIQTSRIAVWRYYRANILPWRREQNPPTPAAPLDPEQLTRLRDQARLLASQRLIDLLGDPNLPPGHLVALIQNENLREKLDLMRAQFDDRVMERQRQQHQDKIRASYEAAGRRAMIPKELDSIYQLARRLESIPPRSTK